ncbi:cationic amino acid transporter 4-like [Antedon mediterranea]|uniref:cationic amino acid transporter 4-like n=1 Tax=Antedon mediterranea TaxID=105859 RepID=UPI003AF7D8A1
MEVLTEFAQNLNRRRRIPVNTLDTDLKRCLTTFDLTLLGISHIFGIGIFILIGIVAKTLAGPAVILSIFLAVFCALLSAFSYMELCNRIPRSGSGYLYVYVVVGEIWAFIIGWNMLLEYLAVATSQAAAFTGNSI